MGSSLVKRTHDQNAILHCWCREISDHLIAGGVKTMSEKISKEITKMHLGNTLIIPLVQEKIAMPTSSYKRSDEDLSQEELDRGELSMESFLTKIQVWASTDLSLELKSPNEEK